MYPEVRAEMGRKNITLTAIAKDPRVDCTVSTLSQKLKGKYPITLKEAVGIKAILNSDLTLEELFKEAEECV